MTWGPFRSLSIGGLVLGILLLVAGVLFLLVNQKVIDITFDLWTVCSLGIIALGAVVIAGSLWARRMMRGGWRRWVDRDDSF